MRLAVLDLLGTTVSDGGLSLEAVKHGLTRVGVPVHGPRYPALRRQAEAAMDRPVARVFTDLLDGDARRARIATDAFEEYLRMAAGSRQVGPVAGAPEAIDALREAGVAVALVAPVGEVTRDALVRAAGLAADVLLCPADAAGRGWPEPDLVVAAAAAVEVDLVDTVVVADTTAGMTAADRAGAGLALGALGGCHGAARLRMAGAHDLVGSVAELPERLGLPRPAGQAVSSGAGGSGAVAP